MKKVLFSANTSWYLYNFRQSTIKKFVDLGHQVICVAPKDEYSKKLIKLGSKHIDISIDNKGKNPLKDLVLIIKLYFIYSKNKPDLIFHFTIKNNIYGAWAAFLARKKFVNNITGLGTIFIQNNLTSKLVYLMYKLSQPFAENIFCQNKDDYNLLIQNNLIAREKLEILPGSGVDLEKFNPRNQKIRKDNEFRFIYCGRMIADKGLNELIAAFSKINEKNIKCYLWLCGFVDEKNHSAISLREIESWKKFHWLKWIGPSDSVNDVLAECDCFVLPSYREGLPKSILEACAMSMPVITTNVPGCREIITNNFNGILCDAKNSDSLKNAILKILSMSTNARSKLGQNGRKLVCEYFDEKIVVKSALDCFGKISKK